MISYRVFQNTDPPALADIWRSQPVEHGRLQQMTAALLEQFVFSKPYFDRQGVIVAVDDERPVGFAHAAFGPSDDEQSVSKQFGLICLVMVRPEYQRQGIGGELLARSEDYLRQRGAEVIYGGGIAPMNGFYLGLYGGSELPGVLDSNEDEQRLFCGRGYREIDRIHVLERDLTEFRSPVDRQQMQIRRRSTVQSVFDPPPRTWWQACAWCGLERTRFELTLRDVGRVAASAVFWPLEPLSGGWGVRAAGLVELEVATDFRRQGIATFLLGEAFKQLHSQGISLVQAQTMQRNAPALALYRKLGFQLVDQGAVYRKEITQTS